MKPMINETETAASSPRPAARFPLVWKISLLVGLTLTISSVVMGLVQNRYFASILEQEARGRAKAIATTLASALVEMPDSAVASTVQAVKKDAGVAYIEVVAANGAILAHTFEGKAPIQQNSQLREGEKVNEVVLDGVSFIDVPATVITGTLVHVGLDPAVIRARLQEAQTQLAAIDLRLQSTARAEAKPEPATVGLDLSKLPQGSDPAPPPEPLPADDPPAVVR